MVPFHRVVWFNAMQISGGCVKLLISVSAFVVSCVVFLAPPAWSSGAELNIVSDTIIRRYDRDDPNRQQYYKLVPAYQYLRLDYGSITTPGLSFHAYGWGRVNLGDDYNMQNTAGELLYSYLEYVPPSRDMQFRLGRQYVFEGVTRDSVDGIYGKADVLPTVAVSAYAGYPVTLDTSNGRRGDVTFGGKVSHHLNNLYDVGVSYKYVADNGNRDEELIGTDVQLSLPANISALGHSTYNAVSGGWGEHSYELRVPFYRFEVRPMYQRFQYKDFFATRANSFNAFRFLAGTDNVITTAGAEAFWYPAEPFEVGVRFKHYDYKIRFGDAQSYTVVANWRTKVLSEVGGEFGRVSGKTAENQYYLGRAYFTWNFRPLFVTGDMVYVKYDQPIYTKDSAFFTSLGVGSKFLDDALKVKLSVDYSRDPYFTRNYQGTLAVNYSFGK